MHSCPPILYKGHWQKQKLQQDLGACDSRNHQKTPSTTVVEEEAMATPDLEETHRKEALREPHKTSDVEVGMKTTMEEHRSGTHPEPLRP
jgi:hypothetical protein